MSPRYSKNHGLNPKLYSSGLPPDVHGIYYNSHQPQPRLMGVAVHKHLKDPKLRTPSVEEDFSTSSLSLQHHEGEKKILSARELSRAVGTYRMSQATAGGEFAQITHILARLDVLEYQLLGEWGGKH